MKCAFLGLVLATGSAAFAQSAAPAVPDRDQLGENRAPVFSGQDLLSSPLLVHPEQFWILGEYPPARANRLGDPSIDPKILLHPTARNLGTMAPGILIAQNQFPGLTLLPIDGAKPVVPIPGTFPNLKIKPIPIDCSRWQLLQSSGGATLVSSQK